MFELGTLCFDRPLEQLQRNILHVDMDAFYASLAERDDPTLEGKPIMMAKHPNETGGRGIVATANYEARKYGVHSGMPSAQAYRLCPHGEFVAVNHPYIRSVSRQIHEIFQQYTLEIERVGYDEAFLSLPMDVDGEDVARQIQKEIKDVMHLTCSVGVSYNKLMAKLASDYQKPNGITVIRPKEADGFLESLNVSDFHGIGPKTTERLNKIGVKTIGELKRVHVDHVREIFGSNTEKMLERMTGIDIQPVIVGREPKSSGNERTYHPFLETNREIHDAMFELVDMLGDRLERERTFGITIILKLRDSNFKNYTKRTTLDYLFNDKVTIYDLAWDLWLDLRGRLTGPVRLMGITLTGLDHQEDGGEGQLVLF